MSAMYKIVMLRHGETEWTNKKLFCGWFDADLNDQGREAAVAAGKMLQDEGYQFDVAHTSALKRAQTTLNLVLQEIGQSDLPVHKSWRLNEKHYGGLTGLHKNETAAKYGRQQVEIWQRSYVIPPPPMESGHPYHETIVNDPRYAADPKPEEFPSCESFEQVIDRTLHYWQDVIAPQIKEGNRIMIVAHANSLRGIVKHLDELSDAAIMELSLPTGIPFMYELDEDLKPVDSMVFLGASDADKKPMALLKV